MANDHGLGKVIICTAPMGSGHTTAAKAIESAIMARWPDSDAEVIDLTEHIYRHVPLSKIFRSFYRFASTFSNGYLQAVMYVAFDTFPVTLSRLTNLFWGRRAAKFLAGLGDVAVAISTFPTVAYILYRRLPPRTPLIVQVTDAGRANKIWFVPNATLFLVIDDVAAEVARSCGVTTDKITITGPPHNPLTVVPTKARARARLQLKDRFTILFTAGGAGLGPRVFDAASALARSGLPVNVILNAGDNKTLAASFRNLCFPVKPLITEFTPDLLTHMAAADIVVGKAGTMTLAETALVGRPTIIVEIVHGHESGNVAYAVRYRIARVAGAEEIPHIIQRYAAAPGDLTADFDLADMQARLRAWPALFADSLRRRIESLPD